MVKISDTVGCANAFMGGEGSRIGKVEWGIEKKVNSGDIREDKKRVLRSLVQSRICKGHTEPDRERFLY